MQEAGRVQEEQCNGQGPATAEPSAAENVDAVPVLEDVDGGSVQNISGISEQGNSERGIPGPVDGEDSTLQATSSDVGGDPVGAQPGEVDGEKPPDCISEESTEPPVSSQGDIAEDGSNKLGEHQEVQMDPVYPPPDAGAVYPPPDAGAVSPPPDLAKEKASDRSPSGSLRRSRPRPRGLRRGRPRDA